VKNQQGSAHTIPFGRADRFSPQSRISSRGANQRQLEIPTRWAASLARHLSAHLHSRKMTPPWLRHGPKTERPAASHHRSDFGWESRVTLFQYRIGAEAFSRFERYCMQRKGLGSFTLFAAALGRQDPFDRIAGPPGVPVLAQILFAPSRRPHCRGSRRLYREARRPAQVLEVITGIYNSFAAKWSGRALLTSAKKVAAASFDGMTVRIRSNLAPATSVVIEHERLAAL